MRELYVQAEFQLHVQAELFFKILLFSKFLVFFLSVWSSRDRQVKWLGTARAPSFSSFKGKGKNTLKEKEFFFYTTIVLNCTAWRAT